jgi:hypothetical protein
LFPLAETIFDCTALPFNKTRYATLYLENTVASGEDRPTYQPVAKRIDSCVLTRMVASTTLQRFAERLFSYAMLAAATDLSVEFSYEAQILRCPRLHPSL